MPHPSHYPVLITLIVFGEECSSSCIDLHPPVTSCFLGPNVFLSTLSSNTDGMRYRVCWTDWQNAVHNRNCNEFLNWKQSAKEDILKKEGFNMSAVHGITSTQPPRMQRVPAALTPGHEAGTHLYLVPRLRMRGTVTPLPQYVFMAWRDTSAWRGTSLSTGKYLIRRITQHSYILDIL